MSPLEAAIRAACEFIGADPETWRGFEALGLAALEGLIGALPDDLAERVREAVG